MSYDWSRYRLNRESNYSRALDHKARLQKLAIPLRYSNWDTCVSDWPRVSRYQQWWVERDYERNTKWKRWVKRSTNRRIRQEARAECRNY